MNDLGLKGKGTILTKIKNSQFSHRGTYLSVRYFTKDEVKVKANCSKKN